MSSCKLRYRTVPDDENGRDWGPRILELTASYLETPLYYTIWGDHLCGRRRFKFSKTPPDEFETAEPQEITNLMSERAEQDLGEIIREFESRYQDDSDDSSDLDAWIESQPLTLEEYKYFHSVVFLCQRT